MARERQRRLQRRSRAEDITIVVLFAGVDASTTIEDIRTVLADQGIVAGSTTYGVVAIATRDAVVSLIAVDHIVSRTTIDLICVEAAEQLIIAGSAQEHVGPSDLARHEVVASPTG